MNDLETLIPQPVELEIAGEKLAILPLKFGKLPAMARACSPFFDVFVAGQKINWLSLVAEHGANVFSALSVAIGRPVEWVEDLSAPDAILLAQAVIEVNADFFIQSVLPALTAAAGAVTKRITDGQTHASS